MCYVWSSQYVPSRKYYNHKLVKFLINLLQPGVAYLYRLFSAGIDKQHGAVMG